MQCIARTKTNIFNQCNFTIFNNTCYCKKHQGSESSINIPLYSERIIEVFINDCLNKKIINKKENDLLMKYILQFYNFNFDANLNIMNTRKNFALFIQKYKKYFINIKSIILLQSYLRKHYVKKLNNLKGPGLFKRNLCVNCNDFYTFEDSTSIEYKYFFSFKEIVHNSENIYCFDMRSFKLLLNSNNLYNPYNRRELDNNIINTFLKLENHLKNNNINIQYKQDVLSEEQIFTQKVIEIFQKIDNFGYNTHIEWFIELSVSKLKKFWIILEDIWNYRSNLSPEAKHNIIQSHRPQPFKHFNNSIKKISTLKLKTLQSYILDDINIFISSGINNDSSNLGCLYVLTALSNVSLQCIQAMPWLLQAI